MDTLLVDEDVKGKQVSEIQKLLKLRTFSDGSCDRQSFWKERLSLFAIRVISPTV